VKSLQLDAALAAFSAELRLWRIQQGFSKKDLAAEMGFHPSYISHLESGRQRPTRNVAERAEAILQADGAIWRRYLAYADLRGTDDGLSPSAAVPQLSLGTVLIVESEIATLRYADGEYSCTIRRELYNVGRQPITQYRAVVSVDAYPEDRELSSRYYRSHPLTTEELGFAAHLGAADAERMDWHANEDLDSYKEILIHFRNSRLSFPLYPGQRATVGYRYRVTDDKWGKWFEREIRLPTQRLTVRVVLPVGLQPMVWGTQTSLQTMGPLQVPIRATAEGTSAIYTWSTLDPPIQSRYRLEWRFRRLPRPAVTGPPAQPRAMRPV
jgi:transcriptional regulator with XRE-family HTH domain